MDPEFDICAWAMGDAKAERASDHVRAQRDTQLASASGFMKAAISAAEQKDRDRTIGSAVGSAVSNFATGYGLSPLLVKAYGGDAERAISLKALRKNPKKHLKAIYGKPALVAGGVLSGAALVGGAIRENVQTAYERGARKHRLKKQREEEKVAASTVAAAMFKEASDSMASTSGPSGALNRVTGSITKPKDDKRKTEYKLMLERRRSRQKTAAFGIMAYTRDPAEAPTSKRPEKATGRAAQMFGGRLDGRHALHKRTERKGEEWHQQNSEFVEIGERPGLSQALSEIMGIEPGQVLSRRELSKALGEKDSVRSRSYEYRRTAKKQDRTATHVPGDTREVVKALQMLLENPEAKFFEVVEA